MATRREREKRQQKRAAVSARRTALEHGGGKTVFKLPENIKVFNPKKPCVVRFDIIPFPAGKGNRFAGEGELYFEKTVFVHAQVGPNKAPKVCNERTFGKPCAICEHRKQLQKDADVEEEVIKSLYPKERQGFNILLHEDGGQEKELMFMEMAYWNFGKTLNMKIAGADKDEDGNGEYDFFADPEIGLTLRVSFIEDSMGKGSYIRAGDIEFKERRKPITEDILEQAIPLDECIVPENYKELSQLFMQTNEAEEEDEDTDDDDDRDDEDSEQTAEDLGIEVNSFVRHEDLGRCRVVKISPDGFALNLKDADGEIHRKVDIAEITIKGKK